MTTLMRNPRPDDRAGALGPGMSRRPLPPKPPPYDGEHNRFEPTSSLTGGVPAPRSPAAAANAIAGYGSDADIAARAQGMVDPLITALSNRIGARARAGSAAIGGYANSLASSLGGYQDSARNIYGQAEQSQAASDAALSAALRGEGDSLAKELGGKLAQISAPPGALSGFAAAPAATGNGSANALLGTGSASLSRLFAEGAHAQDYAAQLPGFARGQGLADIRDLNLAAQRDLYDQSQNVESQIPGIVQGLRGEAERVREYNASQAESKRQFDVSTEQRTALAKLADATTAKGRAQAWKQFQAATAAANTRAANADANRNTRTQEQIDAANRRSQAQIDAANARADKAAKATVDAAKVNAAAGKARTGAATDADTFYYGIEPKRRYVTVKNPDGTTKGKWIVQPGTGKPGVDYPVALQRLMTKYPALTRKEAAAILNDYYAPGERGRPGGVNPATNPNAAGPPAP